jgi:Tol biopolymer transport system component
LGGGGSGNAGAAGERDAGDDAPITEGGSDAVSMPAPRWLVFGHATGTYAYDVTKFPSDTGSTVLNATDAAASAQWSPDARWLLYASANNLYVRDMTGAAPGDPVLLGSVAASTYSWSPDSQSVVVFRAPQLFAIDPHAAAPPFHPVGSSSIKTYAWAPSGSKLAYADDAGVYVVNVTSGTGGTPQLVEARRADAGGGDSLIWSPDGKWLGHGESDGNVALVDLRGATPVATLVTMPPLVRAFPKVVGFRNDSQVFAFTASQTRQVADLYCVALGDPIGPATKLTPDLAGLDHVDVATFNPSAPTFLYSVSLGWFAVSFTGKAPNAPAALPLPASLFTPFDWVPGSSRLILLNGGANSLNLVDTASASPQPVPLFDPLDGSARAIRGFHASPSGAVVAYQTGGNVGIVSLQDPAQKSSTPAALGLSGGTVVTTSWSADSKFVAVVGESTGVSPSTFQTSLIRVDGVLASSAVALKPPSTAPAPSFRITVVWQP